MITMGVGTNLKSMYPSTEPRIAFGSRPSNFEIISNLFISAEKGRGGHEFIGYISCDVEPADNVIRCKLFGPQKRFGGLIDKEKRIAVRLTEAVGEEEPKIQVRMRAQEETEEIIAQEAEEQEGEESEGEGEPKAPRNGKTVYDSFTIFGNPRPPAEEGIPFIEASPEEDDPDMPALEPVPTEAEE